VDAGTVEKHNEIRKVPLSSCTFQSSMAFQVLLIYPTGETKVQVTYRSVEDALKAEEHYDNFFGNATGFTYSPSGKKVQPNLVFAVINEA